MPYKSKSQAAYFNIHKKELEKEGVDVDEWNKSSKGLKLPKKVKKKKMQFAGLIPYNNASPVIGGVAPSINVANQNPTGYKLTNKGQFGDINYQHLMLSNTIKGIAAFFREKHAQNSDNQYYQNQFNPLGYLPQTGNTSEQNQFGTDYMKKGGLTKAKAKEILKDGTAHGHKLTKKQKDYFKSIIGGAKPKVYVPKKKEGGSINSTGYLDGTLTADNNFNIIPGGDITMQGVSQPIVATPIKNSKFGRSRVILPGEDYKFNADYVHERKMQRGGPAPIIVNNPNDKRLKAYNDSLGFYNHLLVKSKTPGDYVNTNFLDKQKPVQPVMYSTGKFKEALAQNNRIPNQAVRILQEYQPPVPQRTHGVPIDQTGAPVVGGIPEMNDINTDNVPTQYTAEVGEGNNRSVKYFKNLEDWKAFTDKTGYYSRSTTGDGSQAQATTYQEGGEVDELDQEIQNSIMENNDKSPKEEIDSPQEKTLAEQDITAQEESSTLLPNDPKEDLTFDPDKSNTDENLDESTGEVGYNSKIPTSNLDMSGHPLLSAFKNGIANVESGGDYYVSGKGSTAYGKYQMLKGTRESIRKEFFPNVPNQDFERAYKTDPKFQEKVMDVYGSHLISKYQDVHKAAISYFLGEGMVDKLQNPSYNPGGNNVSVGQYIKKFDQGYNKKTYKIGGTYELDDEAIKKLKEDGYDFEIM